MPSISDTGSAICVHTSVHRRNVSILIECNQNLSWLFHPDDIHSRFNPLSSLFGMWMEKLKKTWIKDDAALCNKCKWRLHWDGKYWIFFHIVAFLRNGRSFYFKILSRTEIGEENAEGHTIPTLEKPQKLRDQIEHQSIPIVKANIMLNGTFSCTLLYLVRYRRCSEWICESIYYISYLVRRF